VRRALVALGMLLSIQSAACAPADVIIADIPSDDDGGRPSPPPPCVNNGDCASGQFCERDACGDQVGHCRNQPPFCDSTSDTKCGCDGVTYWNDCLRALNGVSKDVDGECPSGVMCGGPSSAACANPNASCGELVFHQEQCSPSPPGECWVLPTACPTGADTDWGACGAPSCTDVCTAIRSGSPYFHLDQSCP
jgi:hypothetical protein